MFDTLASGLGLLACIALGFVIYGFLAPLRVHFLTRRAPADFDYPAPDVRSKPFVGLALSGGGARAAVFAAAGMRALAEKGVLDQVTHVSSVSGGGFTASYWALNPQPPGQNDAYFDAMQAAVAHNFQWDVHLNQIKSPPRLLSPSRRLLSLQDAFKARGFMRNGQGRDATISDLPGTRAYYFNAVSYDTGRRFVISNAALPDPADTDASLLPPAVRALSFSAPTEQRPAPADFPVSLAVATSAAFPPYVGPMTIQIDDDAGRPHEFWHLGDGGLLENPGVETLREAIYARTDKTPATIYSFDAGQRLEPNLNRADISVFSRDIVQMVDVILTYAGAHRDTLYDALDTAHKMPITLVSFNYLALEAMLDNPDLDPDTVTRWTSWSSWRQFKLPERKGSPTPVHRLRNIPTGLSITACDEALIAEAAKFLVERWYLTAPKR